MEKIFFRKARTCGSGCVKFHSNTKTVFKSLLAGIYLLKVNNRNTRTRCETCSKLTIETPEGHHKCYFGVFIVNFEHISHFVIVFLLLTLNMQLPAGSVKHL